MFRTTFDTPIGTLHLFADDSALYRISFPATKTALPEAVSAPENHLLLNQVKQQLNAYFHGSRQRFDLPLAVEGTAFQQAVWKCMLEIPFGETRTYGEIAAALGNPNKARAVGGAANKNPLPIVIPCHRVIGSSGRLTGFAGGLEVKRFLLALEGNASKLL
ncbi:MAG: methylated-DNA--[protein]-cysteine S-methyltransferase [Candidatus Electrothrix sp. EH2]|nr:methylated-DNA--[protein]-cysteine S-methyltransferase [Candidatus Electrothrix sp. EH2]